MLGIKKSIEVTIKEALKEKRLNASVQINTGGRQFEAKILLDNRVDNFHVSGTINDNHFCCGLVELGSFGMNDNLKQLSKENKIELLAKLLKKVVTEQKGVAVCFVTNGNAVCNLLGQAALKSGKFVKGTHWKNPNTNNILTFYTTGKE